MQLRLGTIDVPGLLELPVDQRDALLREAAARPEVVRLGAWPFRFGGILTILVIGYLVLWHDASWLACITAGLVAMAVGVALALPLCLRYQRLNIEAFLRSRLNRPA